MFLKSKPELKLVKTKNKKEKQYRIMQSTLMKQEVNYYDYTI